MTKFAYTYLFRVVEKANPQQSQEDLMKLNDWIIKHRLNSGQTNIKSAPQKKNNNKNKILVSDVS